MPGKYRGAILMASAASIWGSMYVVSKMVLGSVAPIALVWLRYLVALLAFVLLGLITRPGWRLPRRHWFLIAAIGAVGYGVSIWAQFLGTQLTTAQMGAVVTAATPAFMVVFGRLILGERITLGRISAVVLATLGILLVIGFQGVAVGKLAGGLVLLLAAVTWALMSVLVKRVPLDYSPLVVTTYAMGVAFVLVTPLALPQLPALSLVLHRPTLWGGILYLGTVSTAGAFYLWNRGLQLIDAAGNGGLYFFFQPLVGALLGWLMLAETVGWGFGLGSALILIGVGLTIKGVGSGNGRSALPRPCND